MKKSRLFIGSSVLLLTIVVAFATKTNKKFTSPFTVYYIPGVFFPVPLAWGCNTTLILTESGFSKMRFGSTANLYTLYYYNSGLYIPLSTPYF